MPLGGDTTMTDPQATDAPGHGVSHGDDHAHADGDALGPVDFAAWGAGALGIAISIVVALCLVLATSGMA
jgi:hypothetical protein